MTRFAQLTICLAAAALLLFSVSQTQAEPGEPVKGINISIGQEPPGVIRFGGSSTDLPPLPADFFGPGSLPFEGTLQVIRACDDDTDTCDDNPNAVAGGFDFVEGDTSQNYRVGGGGGGGRIAVLGSTITAAFSDGTVTDHEPFVFYDIILSTDPGGGGGTPGGTPDGSTLDIAPGLPGNNFVVDSFFDIEYRIEFVPEGSMNGDPRNPVILGSSVLRIQNDASDPVPVLLIGEAGNPLDPERLLLGHDGTQFTPFTLNSDGGGFTLNLIGVPEPGSLVLLGLGGMTCLVRRQRTPGRNL